jgi:hypothetical protein
MIGGSAVEVASIPYEHDVRDFARNGTDGCFPDIPISYKVKQVLKPFIYDPIYYLGPC